VVFTTGALCVVTVYTDPCTCALSRSCGPPYGIRATEHSNLEQCFYFQIAGTISVGIVRVRDLVQQCSGIEKI
jgi:hypothetical protein